MSQEYEVVVSREIGFGLSNRYPTRLDDLCHKHVKRESDRFLVCSAPYWTWTILQHHLESRVCVKQVQLDCKCATCSVAAQALGQHCKGVGCTPPGQAWPWDTCELWHVMVCGETKTPPNTSIKSMKNQRNVKHRHRATHPYQRTYAVCSVEKNVNLR